MKNTKRSREHEYFYTVEIRAGKNAAGGTVWEIRQVKATSLVEVSRLLKVKADDMRFLTKVIV